LLIPGKRTGGRQFHTRSRRIGEKIAEKGRRRRKRRKRTSFGDGGGRKETALVWRGGAPWGEEGWKKKWLGAERRELVSGLGKKKRKSYHCYYTVKKEQWGGVPYKGKVSS